WAWHGCGDCSSLRSAAALISTHARSCPRFLVRFRLFFFSSRRRHTRCLSDWSSDVCSSDLAVLRPENEKSSDSRLRRLMGSSNRSEERRVGKECSSRWSPYQDKKKKPDVLARVCSRASSSASFTPRA